MSSESSSSVFHVLAGKTKKNTTVACSQRSLQLLDKLSPGKKAIQFIPHVATRLNNGPIIGMLKARGYKWTNQDLHAAAIHGHVDLLRDLISTCASKRFAFRKAELCEVFEQGNMDMIRFLLEEAKGIYSPSVDDANGAARNGHVHIVRYLHDQYGIQCTTYGLVKAIEAGHVEVVKHLIKEQGVKNPSPRHDGNAIDRAAMFGQLEMIRWLRENTDMRVSGRLGLDSAAEYGHLALIQDVREHDGTQCTSRGANNAAGRGHLDIVRDLRMHRIRCTHQGANWAARGGHLEVVHDLRSHGIHCTSKGADWAAERGHLEVVRDLRSHGIHCTAQGLESAAHGGHVDVVRDLLEHESLVMPIEHVQGLAISNKRLPVLKAIYEYMPHLIDSSVLDSAAYGGCLETIRHFREHTNIRCSREGAGSAARSGFSKVVKDLLWHDRLVPTIRDSKFVVWLGDKNLGVIREMVALGMPLTKGAIRQAEQARRNDVQVEQILAFLNTIQLYDEERTDDDDNDDDDDDATTEYEYGSMDEQRSLDYSGDEFDPAAYEVGRDYGSDDDDEEDDEEEEAA